jgi:hypothetical protein
LLTDSAILDWLPSGDVALQYQASRGLLGEDRPDLRTRIAREGWGASCLPAAMMMALGGERFYQPKWTRTHYTLLDLKTFCITPDHPLI